MAIGKNIGAIDASLMKADGIAVPTNIPRTTFLTFVPDKFITNIPIRLSRPYLTIVAPIAREPAINQTASCA